MRAGQAQEATSIGRRKYDLKPVLICERSQDSDRPTRNEILCIGPIEDLLFLVILFRWGKLPVGCQEEK